MARHKTAAQADDQAYESGTQTAAETTQVAEPQPGDEPGQPPKREYNPVRGWTSRLAGPLKYRKFTDDTLRVIAFKFNLGADEKLPEEALAVMREHKTDKDGNATGLKFQDSRKHGKIWTVPKDTEGRALADKIDFALSQIAEKMEAAQGRAT